MPTRSGRSRSAAPQTSTRKQKARTARGTASLNIKNPETCRLVHELAELTGESMTGAVTTAVRERLGHLRDREQDDLADRLLAIGREIAARLGEEYRSLDHDALLYDEKGLPR